MLLSRQSALARRQVVLEYKKNFYKTFFVCLFFVCPNLVKWHDTSGSVVISNHLVNKISHIFCLKLWALLKYGTKMSINTAYDIVRSIFPSLFFFFFYISSQFAFLSTRGRSLLSWTSSRLEDVTNLPTDMNDVLGIGNLTVLTINKTKCY